MATVVLLLEDSAVSLHAGSYVDTQGVTQVRSCTCMPEGKM